MNTYHNQRIFPSAQNNYRSVIDKNLKQDFDAERSQEFELSPETNQVITSI